MRIKDKSIYSCKGCLYAAQAQDGSPACAQFQRLIDIDNDFCSWRIAADQDPKCENCGGPTEGRAIIYNGRVYCTRCGGRVQ